MASGREKSTSGMPKLIQKNSYIQIQIYAMNSVICNYVEEAKQNFTSFCLILDAPNSVWLTRMTILFTKQSISCRVQSSGLHKMIRAACRFSTRCSLFGVQLRHYIRWYTTTHLPVPLRPPNTLRSYSLGLLTSFFRPALPTSFSGF